MTLKYPIKLSSSVRDADGIPLALAKTDDGGSAVVGWKNSSWVLSKSFDVSDVMRSPEALEEQLIEWGIIDNKNEPSRLSANEHQLEMLKKLTPDQIDKAINNANEHIAVESFFLLLKKYIKLNNIILDDLKALKVISTIVRDNLNNLEGNTKEILDLAFMNYTNDFPEVNIIYRLTDHKDEKSIESGNTWEESKAELEDLIKKNDEKKIK